MPLETKANKVNLHLEEETYKQGLICAGTSRIWIRNPRNPIRHLILVDPPPHAPMKDVRAG